jgi:hypothetical protein
LEFKYDPDGRKKSVLLYNWDSDLNDWILDIEEEDIRDADGQLISEMEIRFSVGGYPSRKEYAYDTAGRRITEITTSWAEWSWSWGVKVKNEYTYDSLGVKVMDMVSNWNSRTESWIKNRKTLYGFDPVGRQVLKIEYYWNPDIGDWTGSYELGRQEWAFDPSGREISYSTYEWDPEIKDWVGKAKTEHHYDESGKMIRFAGYDWDHKASVWKGNDDIGKKEWGYDPAGRLITEMVFIWNPQDKDWEENIRLTAMYDPDGDPAEYRQSWWNPDSGEWEKVLRYFFYYKSNVTGQPEIIANDIQVYPNPTEGRIAISGLSQPADIRLYSMQGQLVKTYTGVKGGIDISDLPTGVYLLHLTLGNNTIVKKTVIKK